MNKRKSLVKNTAQGNALRIAGWQGTSVTQPRILDGTPGSPGSPGNEMLLQQSFGELQIVAP